MRAGIALGSNLGDRREHLRAGRAAILSLPTVTEPTLTSSLYETEPVDCQPGDPLFLNAVMEVDGHGTAEDLLVELWRIQTALGRPPSHERNAPRTLDLDLLYFGDAIVQTPELELPHPRMQARRFVLEPLAEIRPDLVLPGGVRKVAELLAQLPATPELVRIASEW